MTAGARLDEALSPQDRSTVGGGYVSLDVVVEGRCSMLTARKHDARLWFCANYLHVPNQPELREEKPVVTVLAGG